MFSLWPIFSLVLLAAVSTLIIAYFDPQTAKGRVRTKAQQLALQLATVGAWITVNGLVFLYLLELEAKLCILRFQDRSLRFQQRYLRFRLNQAFAKHGVQRDAGQQVQKKSHDSFASF